MPDASKSGRTAIDRLGPLAADLKAADPDRFLAGLFAAEPGRAHLFALLAFNAELAKIGEIVSEPMVGEIRLRWWHEQLVPIAAGAPPAHPVAEALSATLGATGLVPAELEPLIDARVADCYPEPYPTAEEFDAYVETTGGVLHGLAARVLARAQGTDLSEEDEAVARKAGRAWARLGVVRALPFNAARGRVVLPRDILAEAGLAPEAGLEGCAADRLAPLLSGLLAQAEADYRDAKRGFARLPRAVRPALLHLAGFSAAARTLRSRNYGLDGRPAAPQPLARQARLLGAALLGRI